MPGVEVTLVAPKTYEEREAAVCEHIASLLREGDEVTPDEIAEFAALAGVDVLAAFEYEPDPAVLVRIKTAAGSTGIRQAERVSQLAVQSYGWDRLASYPE